MQWIKAVCKAMGISNPFMALFLVGAIVLLVIIFREEGIQGVWQTISSDTLLVVKKFVPIMVIFFLLTGSINHWAFKHPTKVKEFISGKYGRIAVLVVSAVLPGPAGAAQLKQEYDANGYNFNIMLGLIGMMGWNVTVLMFRSEFLGPRLTGIWIASVLWILIWVWVLDYFKVSARFT